jgi:glucoamylase
MNQVLGVAAAVFGFMTPPIHQKAVAPFDQQIETQLAISTRLMLDNVSPKDGAAGSVIASPSRQNPDYYFHWVRDAALVMSTVGDLYISAEPKGKDHYRQMLVDFANFSRANQMMPNRSGGLGEPKFHVDGSAFDQDWGRPQNDGPALRALALMKLARELVAEGRSSYVREKLYDGRIPTDSVIKADLEYVAHHWREPGFDLWEETFGYHFYTIIVQRRALVEGARFADFMGDGGAAEYYRFQVGEMTSEINRFWDGERGLIRETRQRIGGLQKDTDLDVGVILGVLHGYADDGFLSVTDDKVLSTAAKIISAFKSIYWINSKSDLGPAIGRYPEDQYDGIGGSQGNPWFLATMAYAELLYRAKTELARTGEVRITRRNRAFFDFVLGKGSPLSKTGMITSSSPAFVQILQRLEETGDSFVRRVLFHRGADGSLSEQFNRDSGFMQSAENLTWSHASFISAIRAR